MNPICRSVVLVSSTLVAATGLLQADEGMWLFNDLPREHLKTTYGFSPSTDWAEHLMKASVRFNSGGSASFVSSRGLVLTNHHVGADTLHKISTPEHNYFLNGFYAQRMSDEIAAPDLELNQLISIQDVSERVRAAIDGKPNPADAAAARRAILATIEKESLDETGLRSDVVTLFGGARYHLYRYKKYTDVRLVWAPEAAIAFFGGDADNFEYPRFDLDACIFRVYENGKPLKVTHFLKWSESGAGQGELIFVSGNPGRTSRIYTAAALRFERDYRLPRRLDFLRRREILLQQFGLQGAEQERRAHDELFGVQNSRKAYTGMLQGLQDPAYISSLQAKEDALIKQLNENKQLKKYADAWQHVASIQNRRVERLNRGVAINTRLFRIAQTLVRLAVEDQKENAVRLREFRESARESLKRQLFSPAPIYKDLEQARTADLLAYLAEQRGGDDRLVATVLAGKSPAARAAELVQETRLENVDVRRRLAAGGQAAVDQCDDPMIRLALQIDAESRRVREIDERIQEELRQAYARIAEARFATHGTTTYPDATFTLRLAFGQVTGYEEDGRQIPAWTTIDGAFGHEKRHGRVAPWELPASWHNRRAKLKGDTQLNFVSTADIIGGNSGSPVVNRDLELVGLIFDGNIQSLPGDFYYDERQARAVSVSSQAIRHALESVYDATRIVNELGR